MNKSFISNIPQDIEDAKNILWWFLQKSENYLYLIWAGCSKESWWKTMVNLWTDFSSSITDFEILKTKAWYSLWENLEDLLSKIKIAESFFESSWKNMEKDEMISFRNEIENKLKKHCKDDIKLSIKSKHKELIWKITNWRKLSLPRAKIFTLNYDDLFEKAWNELQFTIIDWFWFSIPRTFNWVNFDLDIVKRNKNYLEKDDNFERKVFHLYKLHWSINWKEEDDKIIQSNDIDSWKIIYPWSSKYEESYTMPYFEMISRFQQELRKENVTLTIIGYSFSDNHINSMILEAFRTNPSLTLIIVWTSIFQNKYELEDENQEWFIEKREKWWEDFSYFNIIKQWNISLFNEWLEQGRVYLFNMYFESFVNLIPWKEIQTKDEEITEKLLKKFTS